MNKKLLLISNSLENFNELITITESGTLIFIYDVSWTFDNFINRLVNFIEFNNIKKNSLKNVGWIFHGINLNKNEKIKI